MPARASVRGWDDTRLGDVSVRERNAGLMEFQRAEALVHDRARLSNRLGEQEEKKENKQEPVGHLGASRS